MAVEAKSGRSEKDPLDSDGSWAVQLRTSSIVNDDRALVLANASLVKYDCSGGSADSESLVLMASEAELTEELGSTAMQGITELVRESEVDLTAAEVTPCGHKESLARFSAVTEVRIRASGKSCQQYLISAVPPDSPFLRAAVVTPSSEGCCRCDGTRHTNKPFAILVSDCASQQPVVRFACDEHGSATVESPPGEVIGYVTIERVLCSLWLTLRDLHGVVKLKVKGARYCNSQAFANFKILLPDESAEVASLMRIDGFVEPPGVATDYSVEMPESMGNDLKAMLITVAMVFDRRPFA